jgi:AcrR family transcriptional regulator
METQSQTRKATRRELEFRLRRQDIMSAARTLFIAKGLRNTTLDEIAELSAFGKGTIYNYFTNKDDLFLAIIHQLIDETSAEIRTAVNEAAEGARAKLFAYAMATVSHFHTNNEVFLMIMREHNQLDPQMIARFIDRYQERLSFVSQSLQTGMLSGNIRSSDPQKLAILFDGMIRTYVMAVSQGLWPSSGESPTVVAELVVSVFFDGIENKKNQG